MENIDLYIIITTALLASVGHCIGMCGGIVIAYSSAKLDSKDSWARQHIAHLAYNFGRVSTYSVIGALFGLVGQVIAFTPTTKGVLFLLTGVLMILAGLSLVGGLKFLNSAEFSISHNRWYAQKFKSLIASKSLKSFYLLGVLNGMIPCGLVLSFAVFAASSASVVWGAVIMAIFGLATIPTMFTLATLTKVLQNSSLRGVMMKLAALLVISYGGYTIYKGYHFVIEPEMTQKEIDQMNEGSLRSKMQGKCGGMKCEPGKCG
ncbi:MAG: sulfite exporter TauE/SafE family protein [Campylobacterales bacterium]|nr:sulfite exporter TauE/SafE family protein [Campylobacterales bacterium]